MHIGIERDRARKRLLDVAQRIDEPGERPLRSQCRDERDERCRVIELLVAIERHAIRTDRFEHGCNRAQPVDIGRYIATKLHLEPAIAVSRNHRSERDGEPVIGRRRGIDVIIGQRVGHAYRMTRVN